MPIGTYGDIAVHGTGPNKTAPYKARARFRDSDGVVRTVARFGPTKTAAKNALLVALRDRDHRDRTGDINPSTTVADLADAYLATGGIDTVWSISTRQTYETTIRAQIKPNFGGVRLNELRLSLINSKLQDIRDTSGHGAAKTTKTVLTGMCALAISREALDSNPVLGGQRITRTAPKKDIRALTPHEVEIVLQALAEDDERGENNDLRDLVDFMLFTGARIGEVCAARRASVDLEAGTWEIDATVIRQTGVGLLIQHRPKTAAGWRRLAIPEGATALLKRRMDDTARFQGPEGVFFSSPRASALRDKSNTTSRLRAALDHVGCEVCGGTRSVKKSRKGGPQPCPASGPFAWVTSHVFRKTVATRLDEAGLSARLIADQLGHAKPSMTQDVYMGRKVVSAEAARILDR